MSVRTILENIHKKPLKDILIDLYINKDYSMARVAEELDVSLGTVNNWLHENNIVKEKNLWS